MALKPFIGISQIWYGDVFDAAVTAASLKTWLGTATEVKNSHQDTWQYTEDDPTYTDYINELNGEIYYRDVTQKGAKTIAFTMGEWSFDDKVALQGGKKVGTDDGWESSDTPSIVNKGIVGKTKNRQLCSIHQCGCYRQRESSGKEHRFRRYGCSHE